MANFNDFLYRDTYQTAMAKPAASVNNFQPAGTVTTAEGPVLVDSFGRAADGSLPISAPTAFTPAPTIPTNTDTKPTLTQADIDAAYQKGLDAAKATNDTLAKKTAQDNTRTALSDFTSQLSQVGLGSLVTVINNAILDNQTSAQIKDTVRASSEYATRFPGMAALAKKGQAINEATYISMEQGYTQTLHAYGLDVNTFGTTAALGTFIANEVSPTEFNQRVDAAANRVEKNPDVLGALQQYYPSVTKAGVISYLLDPTNGMDIINKQVRSAEIGAAAIGAGFNQFDLNNNPLAATTASNLVSQVGSEDLQTLKKEFGQASILNIAQSRLAAVEGEAYTSDTAIQAAVVGNAQAQLESQRRAAREAARFGGAGSAISKVSTVGSI